MAGFPLKSPVNHRLPSFPKLRPDTEVILADAVIRLPALARTIRGVDEIFAVEVAADVITAGWRI